MKRKLLIIGIGGVTCGGKTTVSHEIQQLLPNIHVKIFSQDKYIFPVTDSRHTWIQDLNHINFDIITSMDMAKMQSDVENYLQDKDILSISRKLTIFNTDNIENICKRLQLKLLKNGIDDILIIEGFLIYNHEPFLHLFHLKYFFTLDKRVCQERRNKRTYEHSAEVDGYFEKYVWPQYLTHFEYVQQIDENINYMDGTMQNPAHKIIKQLYSIIN